MHEFCWPSGKENLCCPLLSSIYCNLESSPLLCLLGSSLFVLPHPANSQQQQGRLLHDGLPKSCQGQGTECHLLRQHLATALTCSCGDTEHKVLRSSKSSSEQPNGPLFQKVCKISIDKNIKFTAKFSDREINNIIHMGPTCPVLPARSAKKKSIFSTKAFY